MERIEIIACRLRHVRPKPGGPGVRIDRFIEKSLVFQGIAQRVERLGITRSNGKGSTTMLHRAIQLTQGDEQIREIIVSFGTIGLETDGHFQRGQGLVGRALLGEQRSKIGMCRKEIRIEQDRSTEAIDRLGILSGFRKCHSSVSLSFGFVARGGRRGGHTKGRF